jgi:predicted AlkP superfamily pyrophosphatase or phosphodiesterase
MLYLKGSTMRHRIELFFLLLFVPFLVFAQQKPKLIVFISIDQMRPDYFERYEKQFTGGLKRFFSDGIVYANADLNYASSETGPGHATLSTGSYPGTSGILANEWYNPAAKRQIYCVEDSTAKPVEGEGGSISPRNLAVNTLGDWLKSESAISRVVSASSKDRAAVLMGGKRPNHVFWYDRKTGHMVTSSYYTEKLPEWVKKFNNANWVEKNLPPAWNKLKSFSEYEADGPDDMQGEMIWGVSSAFPHQFAFDKRYEQILTSPWGDMMVLDFARSALENEKLGQRAVTDLLCISLSCTDYVGHSFGPNSHEIHDHLLRLDLSLGSFLAYVDSVVGKSNVLYVLSADHAVMPLPEYLTKLKKETAKRVFLDKEILPKIAEVEKRLQSEFGTADWIISRYGFLNYAAAKKAKVSEEKFEQKVKDGLMTIDGIADVYFRRELTNKKTKARPYLGHYQRSYYAPRGEDFQIRFLENYLITTRPTGTSHGSPYSYDTHIPLIFMSQHLRPEKIDREVHSVDIAPTLARILGLDYPRTVDGVPLKEVAR